jgi:homeobox protein cut-like
LASQDHLSHTSSELEKQRILNEKLENDLLSMDKHRKPNMNGDVTPSDATSSQTDVLAGLDLGRKTAVSIQYFLHLDLVLIVCFVWQ